MAEKTLGKPFDMDTSEFHRGVYHALLLTVHFLI